MSRVGVFRMLDADRYPGRPLVYQRPFLRAVLGGVTTFFMCMAAYLSIMPTADQDQADPWVLVVPGVIFGGLYQYITARLVVDGTHAWIRNATVSAAVPLGHVVDVELGADLVIVTAYKRFHCTGVEAGMFQVASGLLPGQRGLREAILAAAAGAGNAGDPPARWRLRPPMLLTALMVVVSAAGAVVVAVNGGPLLS